MKKNSTTAVGFPILNGSTIASIAPNLSQSRNRLSSLFGRLGVYLVIALQSTLPPHRTALGQDEVLSPDMAPRRLIQAIIGGQLDEKAIDEAFIRLNALPKGKDEPEQLKLFQEKIRTLTDEVRKQKDELQSLLRGKNPQRAYRALQLLRLGEIAISDPSDLNRWLDYLPPVNGDAKYLFELKTEAALELRKNIGQSHDKKRAADVGRRLGELLRARGGDVQASDPNETLDQIADLFQEPAKTELYRSFRQSFFKVTDPKKPCESACEIVKRGSDLIVQQNSASPPRWYGTSPDVNYDWDYALTALTAVFLLKAAPYCHQPSEALLLLAEKLPKARTAAISQRLRLTDTKSVSNELLNDPDLKPILNEKTRAWLIELANNDNTTAKGETLPSSPLFAYGTLFHRLFLDEVRKRKGALPQPTEAEVNEVKIGFEKQFEDFEDLVKIENQEYVRVEDFTSALTRQFGDLGSLPEVKRKKLDRKAELKLGSRYYSYLRAAAAISAVNQDSLAAEQATKRFREERENRGACGFRYRSFPSSVGELEAVAESDKVEAAARSVTINFALYLDLGPLDRPKTKDERAIDRKALLASLACFDEYGWRAALQSLARTPHPESYEKLGGHYFMPNSPFISAAIRALKADQAVGPDDKQHLEDYSDHFLQILLSQLQGNLFRPMGTWEGADHSRTYVNALGGMALLQYCSREGELASGLFPAAELERNHTAPEFEAFPPPLATRPERPGNLPLEIQH